MKRTALIASLLLIACSGNGAASSQPCEAAPETVAAPENTAPAGAYHLDKAHGSLVFRIDHLGYSRYTASFSDFDAALQFDPDNPSAMSVTATIDPRSLRLNTPPEGFHDTLMGPSWFNAEKFPEIAFKSTKVTQTGPATARVEGAMTFLGVMAPLSFDATFNGGYPGFRPYDPNARVGFSVHGTLRRSDWGFVQGLPPEGTHMGVGDEVDFFIEAEFSGPPAPEAAQ